MGTTTHLEICDAIRDTLRAHADITYVWSPNEIKEDITEDATFHIYVVRGACDAGGGQTDRTTYGAAVRQYELTINIDCYPQQRRHVGEDMAALYDILDDVNEVLMDQDYKPYFGLQDEDGNDVIKAYSWFWDFEAFAYANRPFTGARYTLTVRMF